MLIKNKHTPTTKLIFILSCFIYYYYYYYFSFLTIYITKLVHFRIKFRQINILKHKKKIISREN